jgi:protein-arginine kinase activator protein McsA
MSAPCSNCYEMIAKLNIKKIVFSTDNDFVVCKTCDYSTNHVSQGNRFLNKKFNKKSK